MTIKTIAGTFTLKDAKALRQAYDDAIRRKKKLFVWRGHRWLVSFIYYLLDYLAGELSEPALKPGRKPDGAEHVC